jgi:hypothetical protein
MKEDRRPHDTSHFVPVHTAELIELLSGDQTLPEGAGEQVRKLGELLQDVYHAHYRHKQVAIKNAYFPFDPDSDATPLIALPAAEKQHRLNGLLRDLAWLLDRANFRHLTREEIEPMIQSASDWGIRMNVDFSAFEHVALFVRGEAYQERSLRSLWTLYQPKPIEVPIFRRLVLVLKLRQHPRLGPKVDTEHVFLKIFKDIPRADVDMLLPGARVKLKLFDRGKIGFGMISGVLTVMWRMHEELLQAFHQITVGGNTVWGLTAGIVGYAYKSYYDYQQTRQTYHLNLTQSLYFQNLDSNAGVLTRLFDEAEEQETRITLLAYYCLWRYGGETGLPEDELESAMELYLDRYAEVPLLCESGDPLARLARLELVEGSALRARVVPPEQALERLRALRDRNAPLPPRPGAQSNKRL